jgi:thioredoxin-like negative regulator of GroEL
MILVDIILLSVTAALSWWLSGYDSRVTGESRKADLIRRSVQCGLTLILAGILLWLPPSPAVMPILLVIAGAFFLIWRDSIGELATRVFQRLIDPEDKRPFDPNKHIRQLDMIGSLIRSGRKAEAIQLCETLKVSGEVEITMLELTLEHLGVPQAAAKKINPLNAASQLRRQGKFSEAKLLLDSLLLENPRNLDAAIMLARLYAEDLREPGNAHEILRALEQQPHISTDHIDFARRSIGEWSRRQPEIEAVAEPKAESVDELLAQKLFGSAIELLENKIKAQPHDFDLRLKLAEVQAVRCENFQTAEKIIRQIEVDSDFSREQIERARSKLKEWRDAPLPRK